MSTVQAIPAFSTSPAATSPDCGGKGVGHSSPSPAHLPSTWPAPTPSEPPTSVGVTAPPRSTAHSPTLPALTPDQDRLFEALAKGQTSPAELSATLNLPVRQVLNLLATPEITFHLQVLENAIDYLARHTTRLRHNLAFKSLESALITAAAKDNPGEIRRIATLLLKPTPPLPDPEAEQAERAERITKHRRAASSLPLPLPAGEGRGEGVKIQTAQLTPRAATPSASQAPVKPAVPSASTAPATQPPSHHAQLTTHHSHAPAQPRAA